MNRDIIKIVNTNPYEFENCEYCDFSLPSIYYFYGPVVMLDSIVKPNHQERTIEVPGDRTIKQIFEEQGFKLMDGRIIGIKILPTEQYPDPMEYTPGGYDHSNSVIVPDNLKWGELFGWCMKLEDLCQTELFPIAAAPKEEIESFVKKMLEKRRS